jgi:lysylphosphatidylglycerol synthetase-like protein (DUF2156 family)
MQKRRVPLRQIKKEMEKKEMFTKLIAQKMLVFIVGLIVVGAALFVTGVLIEHSGSGTSAVVSTTQGQTSTGSQDADGGHEATSSTQKSPTVQAHEGVQSETVFGLNLENPWFVTAFVLIWLVLIAALVRFGRIALPAVLLVAVVATVLDAGEVARQFGEAKSLLVTMAVLVTVAHVALAALALFVLLQGIRPRAVQAG